MMRKKIIKNQIVLFVIPYSCYNKTQRNVDIFANVLNSAYFDIIIFKSILRLIVKICTL